jgi:UDP-N-acetylmuramoyl-tripeptide--D-alanyl-D-alanine ligase
MVPLRHPSRPIFVLDDCYNSNPASARAAIAALAELRAPGERAVLVLGDMLELGDASEEAHLALGRDVAELLPDARLLAVGPASERAAATAAALGVASEAVPDAWAAASRVAELLADGRPTALLVKASRGIGLERVVAALGAVAPPEP